MGYPPGQPSGFAPGQQMGYPPSQPSGFPPGQQQGNPSGQQHGGGQQGGPPSTPPPAFTPQMQQVTPFAVDPGAIRRCLNRFTYIWLNTGRSFWFYPVFVGRTSIGGWRWRRNRWVYFGTELNSIRSFQCV
ncbi:transporter [Bacillus sp. S/N-304-OC-R1]|nr:transporter [Bacillus sp. S/N-304-OC-R1]